MQSYRTKNKVLNLILLSALLSSCNNTGSTSPNNSTTNGSVVTSSTNKATGTSNPAILGYYTNWSTYEAKYQPTDIPEQVDTVLYAFAQVGQCGSPDATMLQPDICNKQDSYSGVEVQAGIQDWKLHTTDAWSDFYTYKNNKGDNIGGLGNIAKTLATGKKVLLSVGGWTLSAPIGTAIDDQHRTDFVKSIIDFMHQAEADAASKGVNNKFAGVDIDWEPNANKWTLPTSDVGMKSLSKVDLENYYQFLSELKAALTSNGYSTLTIAMTANPMAISAADTTYGDKYWAKIAAVGVELNVMSYDYNAQAWGGECKYTAFNAPLFKDPANPCTDNTTFNVSDSFAALTTAGVDSAHIGIGVPAYGRVYSLNDINQVTATNPYVGFNPANLNSVLNPAVPGYGDVWTNRNIITGRAYGASSTSTNTVWNTVGDYLSAGQTVATALVNGQTPAFITYSGYSNAKRVMSFAKQNGIAAVMVWSLDQDVQPKDTAGVNQTAPLSWGTTSIVAGLKDGLIETNSVGTKYIVVKNSSSAPKNINFTVTPEGTDIKGTFVNSPVKNGSINEIQPNEVASGKIDYTVENLGLNPMVSNYPPISQLNLENYGNYSVNINDPYAATTTFTPLVGEVSSLANFNSSDTICIEIGDSGVKSSAVLSGNNYGSGCKFGSTPSPTPSPAPSPSPTPAPANNSLEVTNLGKTLGIQVSGISNGSASVGQLDWLNISGSGADFKVYDASTTNPSVAAIEGASELVAHWVTYSGGPAGDCPKFNFTAYTHIMINPDTAQCEVSVANTSGNDNLPW